MATSILTRVAVQNIYDKSPNVTLPRVKLDATDAQILRLSNAFTQLNNMELPKEIRKIETRVLGN